MFDPAEYETNPNFSVHEIEIHETNPTLIPLEVVDE